MTLEREHWMLARPELEVIAFDIDKVTILIAFLDDLHESLPILLVHCSLGQTRDHIKSSVDSHGG